MVKAKEYVLLVDTTLLGMYCGVAIRDLRGELTLVQQHLSFRAIEAARSLPVVFRMYADLYGAEHLTSVLVSNGPGSFTGIKVGMAFVSGLVAGSGFISDARMLSSFDAVGESEGGLWLLAATKQKGYVYDGRNSGPIDFTNESQRKSMITSLNAEHATVNIMGRWELAVEFLTEEGIAFQQYEDDAVGSLSLRSMVKGYKDATIMTAGSELRPNYIRKSTPEEKLEKD